VSREFVTTLHEYPGYRIVECFGIVAAVDTSAGKGAGEKGRGSLNAAFGDLCEAAAKRGANAIIAVQFANFGASLGGMMGDAVGTSVIGTAVRLVRHEPAQE